MKDKMPDLDALRTRVLAEKQSKKSEPVEEHPDAPNTLEKFEALPMEEQVRRMQQKGYTDLALYKSRHYAGKIDINKLRDQMEKDNNE